MHAKVYMEKRRNAPEEIVRESGHGFTLRSQKGAGSVELLMQAIDEKSLEKALQAQGFATTYIWQDGPGVKYREHVHETETAHIILAGEMTLTMGGRSQTFRAGERCDVPAGAVHSAEMGPHGCRYLIGEK